MTNRTYSTTNWSVGQPGTGNSPPPPRGILLRLDGDGGQEQKNKKTSHPYARKGELHTFTSSRAGGALHAIGGTLIAHKAPPQVVFMRYLRFFLNFFNTALAKETIV